MRFILQKKCVMSSVSLVVIFFLLPCFVNAATFFIAPQTKEVRVGDTFNVLVNTDSQGVSINAASANIKFDNELLSVQSVGYSNSIFSIWAEEPTYSNINGKLNFSGGLASPGFNGMNGAILRVTFKAKMAGQAKIFFENSSILANDGLGTNVLKDAFSSNINIIKPAPAVVETKPIKLEIIATSTKEEPVDLFSLPVISNLPDQLVEAEELTFSGKAVSDGQILVYVQKGKNNPEITQINTDKGGNFDFSYRGSIMSGYYKIWARDILAGGVMGTSSDISYVEVVNPASNYKIIKLSFVDIIIVLLITSVTLFVFWIITIIFYLRLKHKKTENK